MIRRRQGLDFRQTDMQADGETDKQTDRQTLLTEIPPTPALEILVNG